MLEDDPALNELSKAAPAFAALGDPVRLAMVARLCKEGPLPTVALKEGMHVTRQGLTKHLNVLEDAGLVSSERFGRDRRWRMQARRLAAARNHLDRISAQWDLRLQRLRALVEGGA
jgi:DNA-binding transcriptional ArsR family regulator